MHTEATDEVIEAFLVAQRAYLAAEGKMHAYFHQLVEKTLLEKGVEAAARIVAGCPGSTARSRLQDMIVQAAMGHFPKEVER